VSTPEPPVPPPAPTWWEDPDLARAVAEIEEFAGTAGWDAAPTLFALVRTAELVAAQPGLAGSLGPDPAVFTAIAQDSLPDTGDAAEPDISAALASISWPDEVAGCVLVQEIVIVPPGESLEPGAEVTAAQAAVHPERQEARLVAGVLRGQPGGACLLRVRHAEADPLRGGDLAPGLVAALQETFAD
jgi:hypothetical protein